MDIGIEWDDHAVAHMLASHGVTVTEAEEALTDLERIAQIPDPASRSGNSDRYIGWSTSRNELLVVIVVHDGDILYGGNAWPANAKAQRIYNERKDT
ncbi:hypothetical protein GCM10027052_13570 [Parafrigoribacterium mesophilum]